MHSHHHQDWEPVILRKKPAVTTEIVQRKIFDGHHQKKLNDNPEGFDHKKIPKKIGDAISKKRIELGLTQTQLAQKINEKPNIVNDIENCRGVYNHVHINKILRSLGLTLKHILHESIKTS